MNLKNLYKTMVTAACLLLPQTFQAQEYFSRIAMEGVELYSMITFGAIDKFEDVDPGLHKMPYDNKFQFDEHEDALIRQYVAGGAVYHDGKIYCNVYDDNFQMQSQKPKWRIYDAKTYEILSEHELGDNCQYTTTSLAYDVTSDKIYGFIKDYTDTYFAEINPENGEMTKLNKLNPLNHYKTLVCTDKGLLYGTVHYSDPKTGAQSLMLYRFRNSDGKEVKVADLKGENLLSPYDGLANSNNEQALFFNNATQKIYWIYGGASYILDAEYTPIFEVNPLNGVCTLVAYLEKPYQMSGAFLMEPELGAPAVIEDFEFAPEDIGALTGKFRIQTPDLSYGGSDLNGGELTLVIKEGEKELVNVKVKAGELYESESYSFTNELHTVNITLSNASGEGPTVKRAFYAGYDIPTQPTNAKLVADGLTTTLTWDAPTAGINGAVINPENIRYKVVRYPYEVIVAENLKERIFVEEHPADMTRYVYTITAYDGTREGGWCYSNNLIVGVPLDIPYGGLFTDPADMYNYYTLIDANGDGFSWAYDQNTASAVYIYNMLNAADDWMIAPPINYKKGIKYNLRFKAYSSHGDYLEAMEVRFGKGRTPDEQDYLLLDLPEVPAVDEDHPVQEFTAPITVDEDGIYYYSFHVISPKFHEFLYLFDIRIEKDPSGIGNNVSDEKVTYYVENETLTVLNPSNLPVEIYDTTGKRLKTSQESEIRLSLQSGIYLIQTPSETFKTVVY